MINYNNIPLQLGHLGKFLGLLSDTGIGWELNTSWFKDPIAELEGCEKSFIDLIYLLELSMVADTQTVPAVFANATWYPFSDYNSDGNSPFYIVSSSPADISGQIGIGIKKQFGGNDVLSDLFLYIPLFTYDKESTAFVLNNIDFPIQAGVNVISASGFKVTSADPSKTVTFQELDITFSVPLTGGEPSLSVIFKGLTGTTKPNTYTKLSELLDPDVSAWLLEVLLNSGSWLNMFVPNTTYTVADLLEEAKYISRSYQFVPANFRIDNSVPASPDLEILDIFTPPFFPAPFDNQIYQDLYSKFSTEQQNSLNDPNFALAAKQQILTDVFNTIICGPSIYDDDKFADIPISQLATTFIEMNVTGDKLIHLNRMLIQDLFSGTIEDNAYSLNLNSIQGTSQQIALSFMFAVLDTLSYFDVPLFFLPFGGVFVDAETSAANGTNYGLRLNGCIEYKNETSDSSVPNIDFCFGTWFSNETDGDNWITRSMGVNTAKAGIAVFALNKSNNGTLSFKPGFSMTSSGINFSGINGTSLVDIAGYSFQSIELRINLSSENWSPAGAVKIDRLTIPLGPGFPSSNGNPIANNILASATPGKDSQDTDPVNPAFSIAVGKANGGKLDVMLYDKYGNPGTAAMFPVNQQFGPLQCDGIGIGWIEESKQLSIIFDGSVSVPSFKIYLDDLSVGIPIDTPSDFSKYSLDVNGLGIAFQQDPIEFSATLIKIPKNPGAHPAIDFIQYDGEALLKAKSFTVSALGSYAYKNDVNGNGYASLFIFGMYIGDLGGPGFFYVTGIAAGFGYNRDLILPDQASVMQFPLVAAMNNPALLGAAQKADGTWASPDPATALKKFNAYVPPSRGEYWLAAGVRFTSFDLINTSALLNVKFGKELEIGLTGISCMSLPAPPVPGNPPPADKFAYVELGLEIQILPYLGQISATAILSQNSYVIDPACHLTGGFAFYVWFGNNPHAGQFVLTIGGYSPNFTAPSYFPQVPRLGFTWSVSDSVTISGDAYFALTPSAIMAGGGLSVIFNDGDLHAWFVAQMDAVVQWAPFQYSFEISISVGVSYKLDLLLTSVTLTVELGAGIQIYGPEMGGVARISWYVISFSVPFGANPPDPNATINWTTFANTLLPNKTNAEQKKSTQFAQNTIVSKDTPELAMLSVAALGGQLTNWTGLDGVLYWVVRPASFAFSVLTTFPTTLLTVTPLSKNDPITSWPASGYTDINIRPLNTVVKSSVLNVELLDVLSGNPYDLAGEFELQQNLASLPAAKWGPSIPVTDNGMAGSPEYNSLLDGYQMGFQTIKPKTTVLTPSGADALSIDITTAFIDFVVDVENTDHLPLSAKQTPSEIIPGAVENPWDEISIALQDNEVITARSDLFNELVTQFGFALETNEPVSLFAKDPGQFLNGYPLILPVIVSKQQIKDGTK